MGRARDEAGNIWETDAQGNPVRLVQQAAPQMPADPAFPYQGAQAQAQAANTGAQAQVNQATIPAQITSAQADATAKTRTAQTAGLPEGFMWDADGKTAVPIPGYTRQGLSPEVRRDAIQVYTDAAALERAADEIERLYNEGPGTTSGLWGLQDYFPTDANKVFNDAGQQARGYVKRALGFTGGEGNTVAESSALYDPYLPTAGDRDVQIEAKIRKLRELARDARSKAVTTLGGVPDQGGGILPNALTVPRVIDGGPDVTAAPQGAATGADPINPAYQAAYEAFVQSGNWTPEQYAAFRGALDKQYYPNAGDQAETYRAEGQRILQRLQQGGSLNLSVPPVERPLSDEGLLGTSAFSEQARNNAVNNPVGAALAGFTDMAGFGGVSALMPEKMAALGREQPGAMALGQIGGAVGGTAALGKLGTETLGRALPQLMGGAGKAQFGRNLATDAAYSAIYGGVTEGDPLTSAVEGGVGSTLGQGLGRGIGRAVGGVDIPAAAQALRARGIPMTVPQQLGGFASRLEDRAMSAPLIGDMIRARRTEGLDAFNRAAFDEAGRPIGATVRDIGQEGIDSLADQVSDAYGDATAGTSVPFDQEFQTDFAGAVARGQRLPSDLRRSLGEVLGARVAPITDTGAMTGEQFQQALRALKATRNRPPTRFEGFEQDYRDAVTGAMDALEGQMMRGGGEQAVSGLTAANAANRNLRTIENAANRAAGGSETGTPFMFTPSQLQRAGMATEKRYPGARPFAELADAGQQVLPSRIPNSGTADRVAQMMLPGAVLGGGAGLGAYAGGDLQGAGTGAALPAAAFLALLAGGTKTGQRALGGALFGRGERAKILGRAIRRRAGLFGSASLPLLITE